MSLVQPSVDPSPIIGFDFFDDFIGATYDNEAWALNGATMVSQNSLNGRVLISGASGYVGLDPNRQFTSAQNINIKWRGILTPGSTSAECGVQNVSVSEWISWYADSGNFKCQCGANAVDSGIAIDANNHIFEIIISTSLLQFFIDGRYAITMNNTTTSAFTPYVWLAGTGSANMDYVLVQGDRQ